MAKLVTTGMDEFVGQLEGVESASSGVAGQMVYEGAAVVADEVRRRIYQIPEREVYDTSSGHKHTRGITAVERQGLLDTLGISRIRNDGGFYNVAIGFDGYNDNVTKAYPNGHPNSMVARTIESGTSWLAKTPFLAPAVQATRNTAVRVMEKIYDNLTVGNKYGRWR